MSIQYDCYFCDTEREMTASWETCTFNKERDKDYWMKGPPCEFSDDVCPFYILREQAHNIVRKEVEKNENNC